MNDASMTMKDLSNARQLPIKRSLCQLTGHLLFAIGIIGILLPVMPTTVFWIGAAACYMKSSPENYHALVSRKRYGESIARFLEHGVISQTEKRIALISMLFSSTALLFLPLDNIAKLFSVMGMAIAAGYVLTRPDQVPVGSEPLGVRQADRIAGQV
jgi:uncharacterized protein